ncbi:MAG: DUF2141 domain-containing protein [Leptolyngbyaceae cyanobacterium CSU_1_4]|nr:DUF2141 domain-containing protein [Leptolyngbyaceae cyanobacterium CSU_1_4]
MSSSNQHSFDDTFSVVQRSCLTVELRGLRSNLGVINIGVFSSQEGFPDDATRAVRSGCFPISTLPLLLTFNDLPFGQYAATVHHDENMDGELNTNLLGIPTEGIGFSGNPKIWRGVPAFERTRFEFSPANSTVSIRVKYLM